MQPSAAIASQLADYDKNKVTSTDALNSALTQYGVPEIRNTVSGLRTTLANTQNAYNAVDPSVTGRTQGSLVTEAQRTKQVSNERAPIAGQISDQSKALGDNQQALTDALGQANTQATNQVNDYNTGRAALQSEYDTAYKSEQDTAAQQLAAQQAAEQQREFNTTQSSKTSTVSAAQTKQQDMGTISQNLNSVKGKDGHVSQQSWNKALSDWTNAGYSAAEFVKNNIQYVNQRYKGYSGFN